MRRLVTAVVLSVLALGTTVSCGGDDGGDVVTDPKAKSPESAPGSKPDKSGGSDADDQKDSDSDGGSGKAKVGDTLSLKGMKDGSRLDVTVEKFADPAKSSNQFLKPASGKKWVAAQFKLDNKGRKAYEDTPSNGAQVADKEGQRFPATIADVTAGPSMAAGVKIPPGETARGWLVFEVPKASVVTSVQWTPDSGIAGDTGQWQTS